ncbi:unnamed protein product [Rotaria sp. Silwood2]|nr:unnamed protein product [Rotaria sp. Silwood2]
MSQQSSFINIRFMRQFIMGKCQESNLTLAEDPFIDDDHNLTQLGVRIFSWDFSIEMFKSKTFKKSHSIEQNKRMIEYFYSKWLESERTTEMKLNIEQIPFLMDQNNRLQLMKDIYFPVETIGNSGGTDCKESFVNENIFHWLNEYQNSKVKEWLQMLNVTERTDLTFLLKMIIPNSTTYINRENTIATIEKLFVLFQKDIIGKNELGQLKTLKLLTTRGTLRPAEKCYFSDKFNPQLPLEVYLETIQDIFLSFDYVTSNLFCVEKENLSEWRRFFSLMVVHENLYFIKFDFDHIITSDEAIQYEFSPDYVLRPSSNGRKIANAYSGLKIISFLQDTTGKTFCVKVNDIFCVLYHSR